MEEDAVEQERFQEGIQASRQKSGESVNIEEGVQGTITPDNNEAKKGDREAKEEQSMTMTSNDEVASIVTAQTCSGSPIEMYPGEKRMLDLHNQTRAKYDLSPLCIHPALMKAARDHSRDMLDRQFLSLFARRL